PRLPRAPARVSRHRLGRGVRRAVAGQGARGLELGRHEPVLRLAVHAAHLGRDGEESRVPRAGRERDPRHVHDDRRRGIRRPPVRLAGRAHPPRVLRRRAHGLLHRVHARGDDRRPAGAARGGGKLIRLATLALVALGGAAVAAPAAERFSVVSNGEVVGYVAAATEGATTTIDYYVDNNGRGPKHRETIALDRNGFPVAWNIEGTSLMGGPVEESFRYADGRARWKSQADEGEVAADEPPLYVANDGSPWAAGLYARVLRGTPAGTMPVLPGGSLSLEAVRELELGEGEAAVRVTVYRLGGVDLAPELVMLDADDRLFATFGATSLVVREGYEALGPSILALGRELQGEHARKLAAELAHRFDVPLRIENVRVFDPESGKTGPPATVLVEGERIAQVLAADAPAAGGEVVIDGEGGTLVPGLHDMHSHSSLRSGLFYLAAGVTAVRDMGNRNDFLGDLMRRIEAGEVAGPRITPAGFIEGRSEHSARHGFVIESLDEGLDAVRWYAERGYWQIKIYNSM